MKTRLSRHLGNFCALFVLAGCSLPPVANHTGAVSDGISTTQAQTTAASNATHHGQRSMFDELPTFNGLNGALENDTASMSPDTSASAQTKSLAQAEPLVDTDPIEFRQTGRASWYGKPFHGRRTANGERYDMHALTAAHRTLPLGSYVRVTNPSTQRAVVVRINDRGPYVGGRIIDLSYAAATVLGLRQVGTAKVRLEGLTRQQAKAARNDTLAINAGRR
ncbi:septal ring lytic transglycosylase RlpA family protein [Paraburkholderia hayleyella]|uniref:septal ring lytic transglycosylase RlpA family protein n=1 Tax=Paraburkholderia hayleyella TaxID=2152889 RepID=UPI00157FC199|nr:septal ring lytic transglycosylase RlpA family protein [Paraburkholderia hayleyella]